MCEVLLYVVHQYYISEKNIVKSVVLGNIAIQIHNYTENNIFMTLYVQTLFVNKSTSNDNAVNQIIIQCCIERDVTLVQTEREIEI